MVQLTWRFFFGIATYTWYTYFFNEENGERNRKAVQAWWDNLTWDQITSGAVTKAGGAAITVTPLKTQPGLQQRPDPGFVAIVPPAANASLASAVARSPATRCARSHTPRARPRCRLTQSLLSSQLQLTYTAAARLRLFSVTST